MADEKAGTGEGEGGAAAASGTPPATGGEQESAEAKIARLERERDEANSKYEQEHRLNLSQRQHVEEANQIRREGQGQPPTRAADPLDQELADLEETLRAYAADNRRDPTTEILYRDKLAQKRQRETYVLFETAKRQAKPTFDALADRELAKRAEALFESGNFRDADAAIGYAKGERYDNTESERARLAKVATDREAELKRRAEGAPGVPPSAGGGSPAVERETVPFSEYLRATKADPNGKGKTLRERRDKGKIVLDMSR